MYPQACLLLLLVAPVFPETLVSLKLHDYWPLSCEKDSSSTCSKCHECLHSRTSQLTISAILRSPVAEYSWKWQPAPSGYMSMVHGQPNFINPVVLPVTHLQPITLWVGLQSGTRFPSACQVHNEISFEARDALQAPLERSVDLPCLTVNVTASAVCAALYGGRRCELQLENSNSTVDTFWDRQAGKAWFSLFLLVSGLLILAVVSMAAMVCWIIGARLRHSRGSYSTSKQERLHNIKNGGAVLIKDEHYIDPNDVPPSPTKNVHFDMIEEFEEMNLVPQETTDQTVRLTSNNYPQMYGQ